MYLFLLKRSEEDVLIPSALLLTPPKNAREYPLKFQAQKQGKLPYIIVASGIQGFRGTPRTWKVPKTGSYIRYL